MNPDQTVIAVSDCSFSIKSGKKNEGKANFYNSIAGLAEQGLEIYVIYIVEVETHLSSSLTVQQTPSRPQTKPRENSRQFAKEILPKPTQKKDIKLKPKSKILQWLMTIQNL